MDLFREYLFDTHAHLSDQQFDPDREALLHQICDSMKGMIHIGSDLVSSKRCLELAQFYPNTYATAGLHPHDASLEGLQTLPEIARLYTQPKIVAAGEMGLDYYYDTHPRELQIEVFDWQLKSASKSGLPCVIHVRDAFLDFFKTVEANSYCHGVVHCFTGNREEAKKCLDLGFYLSFGGILTFKKTEELQEIAKTMPVDRLLIETDSPYLAPVPLRGKRNDPRNVAIVAQKIAELRQMNLEDVLKTTFSNAKKLFTLLLLLFVLPGSVLALDVRALTEKAAKNPRQKELWQPAITALLENNQGEEALKLTESCLRIDALHPFCMGMYSYLLLTVQKRTEEARNFATKTLKFFKGNPYALHTMAWIHYQKKDYAKAWEYFAQIPDEARKTFVQFYQAGLSAWKASVPDKAEKYLLEARKISPSSVPLLISLGMFYEAQAEPKKAIEIYQTALQMEVEEGPVRELLIKKQAQLLPAYQKGSGKKKEEKREFGKSLSWDQVTSKYSQKPAVNQQIVNQQADKKSGPSLQKSKAEPASRIPKRDPAAENPFLKPMDPDVLEAQAAGGVLRLNQDEHYKLGLELYKLGLKQDGDGAMNASIALNSTNSLALSAASSMQEYASLTEMDRTKRLEGLFHLSVSMFSQNQRRFAIHLLQRLLLLEPKHQKARKNLAYLYLETERPLLALQLLEPLIKEAPDYEEANLLYGYCLAKLRRFKDASLVFEALLSQSGGRQFSREYAQELKEEVESYARPVHTQNP